MLAACNSAHSCSRNAAPIISVTVIVSGVESPAMLSHVGPDPRHRADPMDPSADLGHALALLGLEQLPHDPAELARLVVHRHPATSVWGADHSWAYRVLWNRCTPAPEQP